MFAVIEELTESFEDCSRVSLDATIDQTLPRLTHLVGLFLLSLPYMMKVC